MPNSITFTAMLSIDPKAIKTAQLHGYLLGSIAPRPICFASTIDKTGVVNLSPFSFFNVFSANHPLQLAIADYLENEEHFLKLCHFYQQKRDLFLEIISEKYVGEISRKK